MRIVWSAGAVVLAIGIAAACIKLSRDIDRSLPASIPTPSAQGVASTPAIQLPSEGSEALEAYAANPAKGAMAYGGKPFTVAGVVPDIRPMLPEGWTVYLENASGIFECQFNELQGPEVATFAKGEVGRVNCRIRFQVAERHLVMHSCKLPR